MGSAEREGGREREEGGGGEGGIKKGLAGDDDGVWGREKGRGAGCGKASNPGSLSKVRAKNKPKISDFGSPFPAAYACQASLCLTSSFVLFTCARELALFEFDFAFACVCKRVRICVASVFQSLHMGVVREGVPGAAVVSHDLSTQPRSYSKKSCRSFGQEGRKSQN